MTEVKWLECADPHLMLSLVRDTTSTRKLRLYGCGCVGRVRYLLSDPRSRAAVDLAEAHADGGAAKDDLAAAQGAAVQAARAAAAAPPAGAAPPAPPVAGEQVPWRGRAAALAAAAVAGSSGRWGHVREAAREAARHALEAESWGRRAGAGKRFQAGLVRCVFGNPFRPVAFDPRWRTEDTVGLARGMYEDRAFDRLPLLADALMDAGCDDEQILGHCRGQGPHARGCWVVDLVLGKQ